MASRSSFSLLSRNDKTPVLPLHNSRQRSQPSEYDLDELEPRADDRLLSTELHDDDSPTPSRFSTSSQPFSSNRNPTGALNRRPSNASSAGPASKTRPHDHNSPLFFHGPPPPITSSIALYHDEEQRYDDNEEDSGGIAASWLPGNAARALSNVFWDARNNPGARQDRGEQAVTYDRNPVWKGLARRERAVEAAVRRFLQVLEEEALTREAGTDAASASDGAATPVGTTSASMASSRHPGRSVSFLEPESRSGPHGKIVPVRQPPKKKPGINGARKGIAKCLAELWNIRLEEDAALAAALSNRKQALLKLRRLATRQEGIVEELHALEADDQEPSKVELEDLGNEHEGICTEIQDLEKRLKELKTRRRFLEDRMANVKNQREAGLSGYKNALKEVKDTVTDFLARPPVMPLDVKALNEDKKTDLEHLAPSGGVEFMRMLPSRRTIDMAREWWEAEVAILEARQDYVVKDRVALEEGGQLWDEAVAIVQQCEADMRKLMAGSSSDNKGKGKSREIGLDEMLRLQHDIIAVAGAALSEQLHIVEDKGWNLLLAAIGLESLAFERAEQRSKEMLQAAGIYVDDELLAIPGVPREESGTTGSHNSFHTAAVEGGSELLGLPNNHNDAVDSDNEVPQDLLVAQEEEDSNTQAGTSFDGPHSDNEVPPEFLTEHHDEPSSDNEVPADLLREQHVGTG